MKKWMGLMAAVCLVFGMQMTAYAEEKIQDVTVTFSYDKEPESGDYVGSVRASAPAGAPYEVQYAEYVTDSETWVVGDRPLVRVELYAKDGYYFGYESKSHFKLSGCSAVYEDADRYDDNMGMTLEVYFKRIGGTLSAVNGAEWSGTLAVWEELEGAKAYDVRLLRNGNTVTTVETSNTYYDFAGDFNRSGDYTFRVRGIAEYNDRSGEWSQDSDEYYLDEEEIRYLLPAGHWEQQNGKWWYSYDNGGWPESTWKMIGGVWYYFDSDGYMTTGWQRIDGEWYYMDASGAMTTGWQFVNGRWYYMDWDGIMQTDWIEVGGKWYYLDPNGAMYADTITPDGHRVDASGARID